MVNRGEQIGTLNKPQVTAILAQVLNGREKSIALRMRSVNVQIALPNIRKMSVKDIHNTKIKREIKQSRQKSDVETKTIHYWRRQETFERERER